MPFKKNFEFVNIFFFEFWSKKKLRLLSKSKTEKNWLRHSDLRYSIQYVRILIDVFFPFFFRSFSDNHFVCGTDNQTYPTRCHLLRAQCAGHKVNLKHRGSCKGTFTSYFLHYLFKLSIRSTFFHLTSFSLLFFLWQTLSFARNSIHIT